MGLHLWTTVVALTFLVFLSVTVIKAINADQDLIQNLGIEILPDSSKVNISQEEYTRMMQFYLSKLKDSEDSIPQLLTFNAEKKSWRRKIGQGIHVMFPIGSTSVDVEQGELRFLLPPLNFNLNASQSTPTATLTPSIRVFQILGSRHRKLIYEGAVHGSSSQPQWQEIDVTSAVTSWINNFRNLGLEIECRNCTSTIDPNQTFLNVLVHRNRKDIRRRRKRSHRQSNFDKVGRTDCRGKDRKRKCCRHSMNVVFSKLKVPQISSIIHPKSYEAGFCKGRCPMNYNLATNHSRIQSLVHKSDKNNVPKVCCAPSKLAPLEVLRVNPYDVTQLILETWDNMKVLECACS